MRPAVQEGPGDSRPDLDRLFADDVVLAKRLCGAHRRFGSQRPVLFGVAPRRAVAVYGEHAEAGPSN